jgi:hypothetical protein
MHQLLREVVAHHNQTKNKKAIDRLAKLKQSILSLQYAGRKNIAVDEVQEVINLPDHTADTALLEEDPDSVVVEQAVLDQLRDLIVGASKLYRNNPFHNCKLSLGVCLRNIVCTLFLTKFGIYFYVFNNS